MDSGGFNIAKRDEMLYLDFGLAPLSSEDTSENVKEDYEEVTRTLIKSPRGAATLLRLGS